jgi:hypothetical protein
MLDKRTKAYKDSLKSTHEESKKASVFAPPKKTVSIPQSAIKNMSNYTGKVTAKGLPDMRTTLAKQFVAV